MTLVVDGTYQGALDVTELWRYVRVEELKRRGSLHQLQVNQEHTGTVCISSHHSKEREVYRIPEGARIWTLSDGKFCVDLPAERVQLTFTLIGSASPTWRVSRRKTEPVMPRRIPAEPLQLL